LQAFADLEMSFELHERAMSNAQVLKVFSRRMPPMTFGDIGRNRNSGPLKLTAQAVYLRLWKALARAVALCN